MAGCNCGKNAAARAASVTYVHTAPDGTRKTYKSEVEAAAAAQRLGGTYRQQG